MEDIRHGAVGLESNEDERLFLGFDHEGQDMSIKEWEVVIEDCMVPKKQYFVMKMNMKIMNENA